MVYGLTLLLEITSLGLLIWHNGDARALSGGPDARFDYCFLLLVVA